MPRRKSSSTGSPRKKMMGKKATAALMSKKHRFYGASIVGKTAAVAADILAYRRKRDRVRRTGKGYTITRQGAYARMGSPKRRVKRVPMKNYGIHKDEACVSKKAYKRQSRSNQRVGVVRCRRAGAVKRKRSSSKGGAKKKKAAGGVSKKTENRAVAHVVTAKKRLHKQAQKVKPIANKAKGKAAGASGSEIAAAKKIVAMDKATGTVADVKAAVKNGSAKAKKKLAAKKPSNILKPKVMNVPPPLRRKSGRARKPKKHNAAEGY